MSVRGAAAVAAMHTLRLARGRWTCLRAAGRSSSCPWALLAEPVLDSEWKRVAELMEQYLDMPLGMAGASLVALAERHEVVEIASLDHRHLGVVRPRHAPGFTLLP